MQLKKLIASVLLASMTLTMVACSSSTSTSTSTSSSTSSSSSTSTSTSTTTEEVDSNPYGLKGDGLYSCSDEPVTLTLFNHWTSVVVTNDMIIPQEMSAFTNVILDCVAPQYSSDATQSFNLLMTDAVLPDLIGGTIVDINKYATEGAFIALNDLIDEYAPNIRAAFDMYPEAEAAVTMDDGNIYAIPLIYETVVSEGWWIRQDWLDNVGLDIPTTFEEFEEVLYAFRNEDPNGNGEQDEIPFINKNKGSESGITTNLTAIFQLFGLNTFWHTDDDGVVSIGMYDEDYKDAMIKVSEWYADGLIYEQVHTTDGTTRDVYFPQDNGGITFDWMASTSAYNNTMTEYVPDFNLVSMLPPADINGDVWTAYSRTRTATYGWGISCDNENLEASIKFMDFLFTDKGREVSTYGVEGVTFNYNDAGEPIYTDDVLYGEQAVNTTIYNMGGMIPTMGYLHDATYEYQIMHEQGAIGTELYATIANEYLPKLPSLSLTLEESDTISSIYPACLSYMLEKTEVWTYDGSRIEAEFDQYMADLSAMGMDQIVEIYQTAYDRMMDTVA